MSAAGRRGVSPLVGEVLLLAVIIAVLGVLAAYVISGKPGIVYYLTLDVDVYENAIDEYKSVKIVIKHQGGDPIPNPEAELTVYGEEEGTYLENKATNLTFSNPGRFRGGDNAFCYVRRDTDNVHAGDRYTVKILCSESNQWLLGKTVVVKSP